MDIRAHHDQASRCNEIDKQNVRKQWTKFKIIEYLYVRILNYLLIRYASNGKGSFDIISKRIHID